MSKVSVKGAKTKGKMKQIRYFVITIYLLFLCGCLTARPFAPSYFRKSLTPAIKFWQIYQDPNQHIGENILVGGVIAEIRNYSQKTEIEIMQKPLDDNDIPIKSAYSGTKFLALYDGYLDRLIYAPGRLMTIAGTVIEKRVKKGNVRSYIYPVIMIQFYRLWPSQEPYYYLPWFQPKRKEEMTPPYWDSF